MSRLVALVVAFLIVGFSAPALAMPVDIDRADWGMTHEQVRGLFPGLASPPPSPDSDAPRRVYKLSGPIEYGGRTWGSAAFIFEADTDELVKISLESDRSQIPALVDWLTARYGRAFETVGRDEPPGPEFTAFSVKFDAEDGGIVEIQSFSIMGSNLTSVDFESPDRAALAEQSRVAALKALQARDAAAFTGWLNTHWYMSFDEVHALYPAAWKDEFNRLVLDGPFNWHGRAWDYVEFEFRRNIGLTGVTLRIDASQIAAVEAEMRQWYGEPIRATGSRAEQNFVVTFNQPESDAEAQVFLLVLGSNTGSGLAITPKRH